MALPSKTQEAPTLCELSPADQGPGSLARPIHSSWIRAGLNDANMLVGWITSNSPKDLRGRQAEAALVSSNQVPDQRQRSPQDPEAAG